MVCRQGPFPYYWAFPFCCNKYPRRTVSLHIACPVSSSFFYSCFFLVCFARPWSHFLNCLPKVHYQFSLTLVRALWPCCFFLSLLIVIHYDFKLSKLVNGFSLIEILSFGEGSFLRSPSKNMYVIWKGDWVGGHREREAGTRAWWKGEMQICSLMGNYT